jgi:hypothetical protein
VPADHIIDRRNDEAIEHIVNRGEAASLSVSEPPLIGDFLAPQVSSFLPGPPDFDFSPEVIDQRFHVELCAEKTT